MVAAFALWSAAFYFTALAFVYAARAQHVTALGAVLVAVVALVLMFRVRPAAS